MIKEILILLWILIIPLVITIRQLFQDSYSIFLIQKEKRKLPFNKKELKYVILALFALLIAMALRFNIDAKLSSVEAILAAEIFVFDFYVTLIVCIGKNGKKTIFICLFALLNLWVSELWVIQRVLSPTVIWVSAIAYPIFGLSHIASYYLEKGKSS